MECGPHRDLQTPCGRVGHERSSSARRHGIWELEPNLHQELFRRTLSSDDVDGLRALYPPKLASRAGESGYYHGVTPGCGVVFRRGASGPCTLLGSVLFVLFLGGLQRRRA